MTYSKNVSIAIGQEVYFMCDNFTYSKGFILEIDAEKISVSCPNHREVYFGEIWLERVETSKLAVLKLVHEALMNKAKLYDLAIDVEKAKL